MKERQHWHPAAPFRLANGALAEGRPDLTMLMNAREPHESLVREHQVEKAMKDRLDGSGRLAAAQVPRPKTRQPTFNYGRPSDTQLAEFLGADVPHDMIGSTFDRLRDPIPDVQIAPPQLRPNAVARPPSRTGDIRRYKDETVAKHASGLHSQTQHDLNRTAFDPLVPMLQPEPVGHYVRVGVPVAIANQSQPVVLIQDERPASFRSGLQASAMHSGMQLPPASPIRSALGPSDSALLTASQVSFRHATADLPPAAVVAAKRLLDEHRPITVAGLHQRRPPYKDMGPLRPDDAQDVHPDNFQQLLRKNPEIDALGQKRKAFVVGSAAPWQRHKDFQTFEFMAKQTGHKYYVSDFTQPSKAPMRPPTAGTTAPYQAPSMMYRPAPLHEMRQRIKESELDSTIRYDHPDKHVSSRRPVTAPGAHLLPYLNAPERQRTFFP